MRGTLVLLGILGLLLSSACASPTKPSGYQVTVPLLTYRPLYRDCTVTDTTTGERTEAQCVLLFAPDWYEIVIELKAACLGSGQREDQCGIAQPIGTPPAAPRSGPSMQRPSPAPTAWH